MGEKFFGKDLPRKLRSRKATLLFFTSRHCSPCREQENMMKETTGSPPTLTDVQYRYGNDVGILVTNVSPPNRENQKLFQEVLDTVPEVSDGTPLNVFYKGETRRTIISGAISKKELFSRLDTLTETPCPLFWCKIKRLVGQYRDRSV